MAAAELSRSQAAAYLKTHWGLSYSPGTLASPGIAGGSGPAFVRRHGRTYYAINSLDTWVLEKCGPMIRGNGGRAAGMSVGKLKNGQKFYRERPQLAMQRHGLRALATTPHPPYLHQPSDRRERRKRFIGNCGLLFVHLLTR